MVAIILGAADTVANAIAQHPIYSSRIWRPVSGSRSGLDGLLSAGPTLVFHHHGSNGTTTRRPELGVFGPVDDAGPIGGPHAPTEQILVSEQVEAWVRTPVRVAVGRVVLCPGARVVPIGDETLFLAVEAGTMALSGLSGGEGRRIMAVAGTMEPPGAGRAFGNPGPRLLVLLVLTISPAAA